MAAEDVWEKSCCYRPWNGEDGLPIPPYAVYNIGNASDINNDKTLPMQLESGLFDKKLKY